MGPVRIAVLRRFVQAPDEAHLANLHANIILPIAGGFGHTTFTEDLSLKGAETSPFWETATAVGGNFNAIEFGDPAWREAFDFEFARSDYAVLDWSVRPTPNMLLEFDLASKHLPLNRLIFITTPQSAASVGAIVREHFGRVASAGFANIELSGEAAQWAAAGREFNKALRAFSASIARTSTRDQRPERVPEPAAQTVSSNY